MRIFNLNKYGFEVRFSILSISHISVENEILGGQVLYYDTMIS